MFLESIFSAIERIVIVNVDSNSQIETPLTGELDHSREETPAHLAFRQIVVHEFAEGSDTQTVRMHFHYREHSKHIGRLG